MPKKPGYADVPQGFDAYDASKIVVLPVPYDGTSTWMKGADKGPTKIIEASWNMYLYDIETDSEVYKQGIYTDKPVRENSTPEAMVRAVKSRVATHVNKDKFVVTLGGEHSVSIGAVQAHAAKYTNLSVLQLDAHADLQEEFHGSRYNHACVMARVREVCPVVQVGIRSMDIPDRETPEQGRIFYAHEIHGSHKWMDRAVSKLTDQVYVTIDVDAFDISTMPATGTPEPGGLLWYDVMALLRKVTVKKKVIGFDVVELCPHKFSRTYDYMAAKLVYKFLSYAFR